MKGKTEKEREIGERANKQPDPPTHTHTHPTDLQGQACRISIRITMQPPTRQSNTHTHSITDSQTASSDKCTKPNL